METTQYQIATPESIWAILRETAKRQEEWQAEYAKRQTEYATQQTEYAKRQTEYDKRQKKQQAEYTKRQQEYEEQRKKANEDFDHQMEKLNKSLGITSTQIDNLQKTVGGWANNHGSFAEEYFYNSFEKGQQNFFGKKFDMIEKKVKGAWKNIQDEYDIVLYNDDAVAIIEVKFKAHENDIDTVLKKAETFKILCPYYKDYKIYLGLASMAFYPELEQACIENGIAIIKQVGDKVVINDKHLKVF